MKKWSQNLKFKNFLNPVDISQIHVSKFGHYGRFFATHTSSIFQIKQKITQTAKSQEITQTAKSHKKSHSQLNSIHTSRLFQITLNKSHNSSHTGNSWQLTQTHFKSHKKSHSQLNSSHTTR